MTRGQNETATRGGRIATDRRKELGPGLLTGSVKSADEPTNCGIGMWRRLERVLKVPVGLGSIAG